MPAVGWTLKNGGKFVSCIAFGFGLLFGAADRFVLLKDTIWPDGVLDSFHDIDDIGFDKIFSDLISHNPGIRRKYLGSTVRFFRQEDVGPHR